MIRKRRGMGDANVNPNSPNIEINPDTGAAVQCDFAHPLNIFNAACWGYGSLYGPTAALNVTAPAPPAVTTEAQLDEVQASDDPTAAANALIQSLINQGILQTQANNAAANPPPPAPAPAAAAAAAAAFCGTGSTQWISGLDNCTLLLGAGAVVLGIFLLGALKR